ncbi:MAG: Holliday junction ATP-dependent DNA helicase RuvB [Parcubacteria group bacterium GW2011_GWA2_47_7]|nr:MAG: Holliday junction ATP-dependent DNA helicase RuvB [Parcubacteria group bacterium GW2011_GWA2_47_7]
MKKNNESSEGNGQSSHKEALFLDQKLRPEAWADYVGQTHIKQNLEILLSAAKERAHPPEHLLFYGPPGLGKTTLAHLIAKETSAQMKITSGPAIEKVGIIIGKGPSARTIQLELPPFTLIAATTRIALLSAPLRSRFSGGVFRLEFYTEEEIEEIVTRSSKILGVPLEKGAGKEISTRSRFTPRTANYFLKRARDFAQVNKTGLDVHAVKEALRLLEIDEIGLNQPDRHMLTVLIEKFGGRPVGLGTIAAATSEEEATIEEVYEPYLLKLGLLERTPRGRIPTKKAYEHLGFDYPKDAQEKLL